MVKPENKPPTTVPFRLVVLQTPPVESGVNNTGVPIQALVAPAKAPAGGRNKTFTIRTAVSLPQLFETVYQIVSIPDEMPEIRLSTNEAWPLVVSQLPPGELVFMVIVAPIQTADGPVKVPAEGSGLMVIIFCAKSVPHKFVSRYLMVSNPGVLPVTILPVIVALLLLKLHVPVATLSVKLILEPGQTVESPLMTPALGSGLTEIIAVAESDPHKLETL